MKSPRNAAQSDGDADTKHIWIVYDGMCPFCTSYVMRYRIGQLADDAHDRCARSATLGQEVKAGGLI
jgi:predicted DCC family thiol-disulfide oxidoreductase YuxK